VQCVVTSPPYWGLRDYGIDNQLGLESTPEEYVEKMVEVFRQIKRVLKHDGTVWLNLGDSYNAMTGSQNLDRLGEKYRGGGHKASDPKYKLTKSTPTGLKPKDLIGIPWRVAFALQADGFWLRQDIIWEKGNPMPESVQDRCTKAHEYIFLLTKSAQYFYDNDAIREPLKSGPSDIKKMMEDKDRIAAKHLNGDFPLHKANKQSKVGRKRAVGTIRGYKTKDGEVGQSPQFHGQDVSYNLLGRNRRSVWTINTQPYKEAHFAVFPEKLPELCIKAGTKKGDTVLDPFFGSGTTGYVAQRLGRKWIGIELNEEYIKIAEKRFAQQEMF